jgi:hypothetical protein
VEQEVDDDRNIAGPVICERPKSQARDVAGEEKNKVCADDTFRCYEFKEGKKKSG